MKADRIRLQVSQALTHVTHGGAAATSAEDFATELAKATFNEETCNATECGRIAADLLDAATELQEAANGLTVLATRIQERCHG
jgi:hypothetical protein